MSHVFRNTRLVQVTVGNVDFTDIESMTITPNGESTAESGRTGKRVVDVTTDDSATVEMVFKYCTELYFRIMAAQKLAIQQNRNLILRNFYLNDQNTGETIRLKTITLLNRPGYTLGGGDNGDRTLNWDACNFEWDRNEQTVPPEIEL